MLCHKKSRCKESSNFSSLSCYSFPVSPDKGNAGSGNEIGENPVKYSACVVGQKIEIECLSVFSEMRTFHKNHSLEFHKRWQDET